MYHDIFRARIVFILEIVQLRYYVIVKVCRDLGYQVLFLVLFSPARSVTCFQCLTRTVEEFLLRLLLLPRREPGSLGTVSVEQRRWGLLSRLFCLWKW